MTPIGLVLISAAVSALIVAMVLRVVRRRVLDVPNERSSHTVPTPTLGGLGVVGVLAVYWIVVLGAGASSHTQDVLIACVLGIALLGLVDDVRNLSARVRLATQLLLASVLVWQIGGLDVLALPTGGAVELGFMGSVLGVLWLVWMTNLYNFMDGIDGLAGGMAVFASGTFAALLGGSELGAACVVVCGGSLGFLRFNFPPARIFMGDVGACALGFFFGAVALIGPLKGEAPFIAFTFVLAPFIFDATVTLVRRALNGERFWAAHRSHFYQRLTKLGWSHRRVTVLEYAMTIVLAALGMAYAVGGTGARFVTIGAGLSVVVSFAVGITRAERRAGAVSRGEPS